MQSPPAPRLLKHVLGYLGHLGFWVSAVVILVMGLMLFRASVAMKLSSQQVSHTEQVLYTTNEISEHLSRAESDLRGYLLAGDVRYMAGSDALFQDLADSVQSLRALTLDNPEQQARALLLEQILAERIALMQKTLALYRAGQVRAARDFATSGAGRAVTEKIRALTGEMRELEQTLLAERQRTEQLRYQQTLRMLILTVLVSLMVLVPGYIGLILQTRAPAYRGAARKFLHARAGHAVHRHPGRLFQAPQPGFHPDPGLERGRAAGTAVHQFRAQRRSGRHPAGDEAAAADR